MAGRVRSSLSLSTRDSGPVTPKSVQVSLLVLLIVCSVPPKNGMAPREGMRTLLSQKMVHYKQKATGESYDSVYGTLSMMKL